MKTSSQCFKKLFRIGSGILFILLVFTQAPYAQNFKLYGVSDMVRVFEDGYKMPPLSDSIKVFGIRGEIISGQFAINSKKNLSDVTVAISLLKNPETGIGLPETSAGWNFVGSIPLSVNTPNQPLSAIVRPAPSNFPEYLREERHIAIKEKTWQSVWLTIKIPENAPDGKYLGTVKVIGDKEQQSLPVNLTIYPLSIPSKRHLDVVEWYNTSGFSRFHGISEVYSPEWFKMLGIYADNMASHRQNIFQVPMESISITRNANGDLSFDFSQFDKIAHVFWNTGKMDYLETGELTTFGKERWNSTRIYLQDFNVKDIQKGEEVSLPGKDVIPFLMPEFESHLKQKGWLKKTIFGIKDEPSLHNALSWNEASEYIHKYAPDLKRMDAIETTQVLNNIEIAIPKLDHLATWYDSFNEWANKGNVLWFYTVGIYQGSLYPNKTIDMPLIDSRLMHWLNYRYGVTGYLHWGWNQWNENPFVDVGMHIGDGWHVYPAKDGVLNSLRWEEMRNGIQDYEYLWMIGDRIKSLKDSLGVRFSWINPKQRGEEIAGKVIKGFADHTDDPEVLENAKMQAIKELIDFNRTPGLYVQTNPVEGSLITSGSSVEVMGWTEPGTKIIVNNKELPVTGEGLFLDQFGLSQKNAKITVQAIKNSSLKEIVREFKMK